MEINEEERRAIGRRLKAIRETLGLVLEELSAELKISIGGLSEIETGKRLPKYKLLKNLSEKHNVNIDYLLLGEGGMFKGEGSVEERLISGQREEDKGFWRAFYFYLKHSPTFRNTFMAYCRKFILENDRFIRKDMALYKEELTGEK
jgi:transcriptional regulator with XRE-family HTH domain